MTASHDAVRRIGWAVLLAVCGALLFGMSLMVNAVRSEVRRTELKILAMKHEMHYLDTEFETRANQQQLEAWNDVDFGYVAPTASQYLVNERQLALLGKPVAPSPILLAAADPGQAARAASVPAAAKPAAVVPKQLAASAAKPGKAERDRAGERVAERTAKPLSAERKGPAPEAKPVKVARVPAAAAEAQPASPPARSPAAPAPAPPRPAKKADRSRFAAADVG